MSFESGLALGSQMASNAIQSGQNADRLQMEQDMNVKRLEGMKFEMEAAKKMGEDKVRAVDSLKMFNEKVRVLGKDASPETFAALAAEHLVDISKDPTSFRAYQLTQDAYSKTFAYQVNTLGQMESLSTLKEAAELGIYPDIAGYSKIIQDPATPPETKAETLKSMRDLLDKTRQRKIIENKRLQTDIEIDAKTRLAEGYGDAEAEKASQRKIAEAQADDASKARYSGAKAPTEFQGKAQTFLAEMQQAEARGLDLLKSAAPTTAGGAIKQGMVASGGITGKLGRVLSSKDAVSYSDATGKWIEAVLRQKSGAAIAQTEYDAARNQFFPGYGDDENQIVYKAALRRTAMNTMANLASTTGKLAGPEDNWWKGIRPESVSQGSAAPTVTTRADYNKLEPGQSYIGKDGQTYKKPKS